MIAVTARAGGHTCSVSRTVEPEPGSFCRLSIPDATQGSWRRQAHWPR
jgi:hypothetical protein